LVYLYHILYTYTAICNGNISLAIALNSCKKVRNGHGHLHCKYASEAIITTF